MIRISSTGEPLVSIVIPCWNGELFVKGAIESALAQTYERTEIIVVDDGSTDGSIDILRSFGGLIRWETGPNRGACHARNVGVSLARGEIIQFLDSDDRLHPTKIAAQLDVMRRSGVDSVYCDAWAYRQSDSRDYGKVRPHAQNDDAVVRALGANAGTTAGLHRREIIERVGGFDQSLPCAQERDLHLRLACHGGNAAKVLDVLVDTLMRPDSVSADAIKVLDQHERIVLRAHGLLKEQDTLTEPRAFALARFLANASRVYYSRAYVEQARRYWLVAERLHAAGASSVYKNTEWPVRRLIGASVFDRGLFFLRKAFGRC